MDGFWSGGGVMGHRFWGGLGLGQGRETEDKNGEQPQRLHAGFSGKGIVAMGLVKGANSLKRALDNDYGLAVV
jgi:hypothetical protein